MLKLKLKIYYHLLRNVDLLEKYLSLTTREEEIFLHTISGKLSKQIASELNINVKTVESHRSSINKKLDIKNIPEFLYILLLN